MFWLLVMLSVQYSRACCAPLIDSNWRIVARKRACSKEHIFSHLLALQRQRD